MNIVVLVKIVPDIEKVTFNVENGTVNRASAPQEINPFDLNALEEAVKIKEEAGGRVTVVCMGPPEAKEALKDALARGADRAVLLSDKKLAGSDTLATSYALSCAIKKLGEFDLILCGEKTTDGDTGQVGAETAEHLGIPHAYYVSRLSIEGKNAVVHSEMENRLLVMEFPLPMLVSVTKDINAPRLPSLKSKLASRKKEVEVWSAADLGADETRLGFPGSPTMVYKVTFPTEEGRKGLIFKDTTEGIKEIAKALAFFRVCRT